MGRALTVCVLAACCAAPFAGPLPQRGRADEPARSERAVAELIRNLGSADFAAREAATRRLLEWETPPPALRAALTSGDREVAHRAARIVHEIARREEKAAFGKLTEFAQRGEIDRFIELLVRRPKWEDEEACWQVVAELNGKLLDLKREKYQRPSSDRTGVHPVGDFSRYVRSQHPRMLAARRADFKGGCFVVRAEHISTESVTFGLLVSSRGTRVHEAYSSVVLAGGPVEAQIIASPLLVCAADVKSYHASGCLIIARGDVRIAGSANDCRIITAGSVQFLPNKVLDGKVPRRKNVEIKEHEPNPLGFVRWFDPARVGVTVEAATGGVRVKAAGKSFAAAGLRAGDLLAAIDGEAVKSPDEFRLLLRAKLADGGKMALAVRRAGKDLTIPVRCKD